MIGLAMPRQNWHRAILAVLLLAGLIGAAFAFSPSYFSNSNVLMGFFLVPFSLFFTGPKRNNLLYAGLFGVCATLAFIYGVRIFYFFALAFYFLWFTELFLGSLNALILFLIVFMSPFFIQVVTILGFPLRLLLSSGAGAILNVAGVNVEVEGNMMILDGSMFSVDEACMGLNMLSMSMLMGVFALAYRYRVSGAALGLASSVIFFGVVFVLNVITNVIRIIVLVYFRIPPEDPMHEFVGVLCLVVYVAIPLYFLAGWFVQRYGKVKRQATSRMALSRSDIALVAILPLLAISVGASIDHNRQDIGIVHADVRFGQAATEKLNDGITKIATKDLLIYVKIIPEFFTGEHTPLMCWKGSGYEFSGVTTAVVGGMVIYKGRLVKDGDTLHTAWWYSNGKVETISQLDWRTRMLRGEDDFCLVNVTARDEEMLLESISSMLAAGAMVIRT